MTNINYGSETDALDEILLDIATLIELSPRDWRIAENRYRILKTHLERKKSPLAIFLVEGSSFIYAQGSIATSTTIVSGEGDDRFDVDAIVEFNVPPYWSDSKALDLLEESLQQFPNVEAIIRCTRCVQLQFPTMHMDVTVLDRKQNTPIERAGDIFHSPDDGQAYRVPSNPWGFTKWFRSGISTGDRRIFSEMIGNRRNTINMPRLKTLDREELIIAEAEQVELPPMIPNVIDAQEAVALKLLKRFLNLRYSVLAEKRPPSIYIAKRTGVLGLVKGGLTIQLAVLANEIAKIMRQHLADGTRPEEENPSYSEDKINDRWPSKEKKGVAEMKVLAENLELLVSELEAMNRASLTDIAMKIDNLFGEKIGKKQRSFYIERYDRRISTAPILTNNKAGGIVAPTVISPSEKYEEVPKHNFHPFKLGISDDSNT